MSGRRLDSHLINRLVALGLEDTSWLVRAAEFVERRSDGYHEMHCILSGFEAPGATSFVECFPLLMDALVPLLPPPAEAANDRAPRLLSEQRRVRYATLAEHDGPACSDCGCGEGVIWRRQGVWNNDFGLYTKVHPTTNLEVDHRKPLWAGGTNDLSNLWLLCIGCHKRKTAAEAGQRRRA